MLFLSRVSGCDLHAAAPLGHKLEVRFLQDLVWGLGFGGLKFGVWGLKSGVWGLGFGFWGVGFGIWSLGFGEHQEE